MRTAATNPRRAVADAWEEAEAVQWPAPDAAFAPPPDDIDTDDVRAVKGIATAAAVGALCWLALWWAWPS